MRHHAKPGALSCVAILAALVMGLVLAAPAAAQSLRPPSQSMVAGLMLKAREGNARDQYLVGLLYERGQGLPQDYTQAAQWYGKAAKQGLAKAQLSLGNLYDKGLGVPQSYETAYRWYRQAAAGGNGQAMYFVGSMLYNGDGVPADREAAASWFQRAMAAGFTPAKAAYERVHGELQGASSTAAPAAAPPPPAAPAPPAPPAPPAAPAQPAPPPASNAPAPAPDQNAETPPAGVYAVQVGSFPDRRMAQAAWTRLQRKLPADLAAAGPVIYRKTLKDKRQVWRLNAGAFAQKDKARARCARLKASQVDCLVIHY